MKLLYSCIYILLIVILSGCSSTILILKESDSLSVNHFQIGETFIIKLDANYTTGYEWSIQDSSFLKILSIEENEYEPTSNDELIVGAGGLEIWKFRTISKGKTNLIFQYKRDWEKDKDAEKTLNYEIIVN